MSEPVFVALLSKEQAAAALAMSLRRLNDLVSAGEIAAVREGGRVKFRPKDIQAYADNLPAWEPRRSA